MVRSRPYWPETPTRAGPAMTGPTDSPLIVEAIAKLRSRSCIIDGEAVACGEDGIDRQKMRPCFPRRS